MWSCCEISSFIILYTCLHIFEHSTCTLDFRILMLLSSVQLKCFSSPLSGFWIVAHHLNTQNATDKRLCAKNESYFCKNFMHRYSNEWKIILGWYLSLSLSHDCFLLSLYQFTIHELSTVYWCYLWCRNSIKGTQSITCSCQAKCCWGALCHGMTGAKEWFLRIWWWSFVLCMKWIISCMIWGFPSVTDED